MDIKKLEKFKVNLKSMIGDLIDAKEERSVIDVLPLLTKSLFYIEYLNKLKLADIKFEKYLELELEECDELEERISNKKREKVN